VRQQISWHTEIVPLRCTCGATLPDDARFCHKCGKPQREEPLLAEQPAPPPLPALKKFPPIGLGNGLAVRIALLGGASSLAISMLSAQLLAPAVSLLWLVVAGFFCVALYRRRTGQKLSMINGAHLGWICGLFVFVLMGLMFTVTVMSDPGSLSSAMEAMRNQLTASARPGIDVNQIMEAMRSPVGILFGFLGAFLLLTCLPAFGGAIGAKLLDRE
jgi:zinc-ribbon domain